MGVVVKVSIEQRLRLSDTSEDGAYLEDRLLWESQRWRNEETKREVWDRVFTKTESYTTTRTYLSIDAEAHNAWFGSTPSVLQLTLYELDDGRRFGCPSRSVLVWSGWPWKGCQRRFEQICCSRSAGQVAHQHGLVHACACTRACVCVKRQASVSSIDSM